QFYRRVNLVSDIAGVARFTDPNLVNPWGLAFGPTSPFWVADNGAGVATLYNGRGQAFPLASPLVVTIPSPTSATGGTPTGAVFNGTGEFVVSAGSKSGSPLFLFATEDCTILGWSPAVNPTIAVVAVNNSGLGAVYKGLAIGSTTSGNFLYAANFHAGTVEMYDKNFHQVKTFTDANVDANFAPFGIQNIGGRLFVTFAKQKLPDKHDDDAGQGNGFVDVFDTSGNLIRRFAAHGALNSPWGLALAPGHFGKFSHHLLVGNFGDGRISAFDADTAEFDGQLIDPEGNPLTINGLWALQFGSGAPNNGSRHKLFFTAGIADESHGLFGFITAGREEEDD
ncbi:MAG TPA: TIGR03118 family protein, partial [Candidatus Acidoferrales bacterium]|nr:TIGR03118 family protein [Candidatus Acidoferrales bacterium]